MVFGTSDTMRIDVFTLFPDVINSFANVGVIGRGRSEGLLEVNTHNFRDATTDVHRTVDDSPFGGGAGMVLKPGPIVEMVEQVDPPRPVIFLSPSGDTFSQSYAQDLASSDGFSLICGRYEGLDQRAIDAVVDREVSIGDFVLAGGEVAAAAMIEAVGRLIPGVVGNSDSTVEESFSDGLLEYPQYTRPAEFDGESVPPELLSGNHGLVAEWRLAHSLARTLARRPDLIAVRGGITAEEETLLGKFHLR
jgi:tRNA (guanine37-N1)-methyltransferase